MLPHFGPRLLQRGRGPASQATRGKPTRRGAHGSGQRQHGLVALWPRGQAWVQPTAKWSVMHGPGAVAVGGSRLGPRPRQAEADQPDRSFFLYVRADQSRHDELRR